MDHTPDSQDRLIGRYLGGRMTPAEESEWEAHYLTCPACFEALEAAAMLKGVILADRAGSMRRTPPTARPWWRVLFAAPLANRLALAAVLIAVGVPGVAGWLRVGRLTREVDALSRPTAYTRSYLLDGLTRGGAFPTVHANAASTFLLHVHPLDLAPGGYRVRLLDSRGRAVWEQAPVLADPEFGTLTLVCRGAGLATGDYVLEVTSASRDSRPAAVFPFRLRNEARSPQTLSPDGGER